MRFNLQRMRDPVTAVDVIKFDGEVHAFDLVKLSLDNFDRALLDDVNNDTSATAADYLLVLEMLFRRLQEQDARSKP